MSKYKALRAKLIKEGAIAGGVVVVVAIIMSLVSGWRDNEEMARGSAQALLSQVQGEVNTTRERFESSGAFAKIFNQLRKNRENQDYTLNRQAIRNLLAVLKGQYSLTTLNIEISPIQTFSTKELEAAKVGAEVAEVKMTFGGLTDRHLYTFVSELRRNMPGFVKIKQLQVVRKKTFDVNTMREIGRGAEVEMVTGTLVFDWFGFTEFKEKKDEAGT